MPLPPLFLERLKKILPDDPQLCLFARRPDKAFRINTLKASPAEIHKWLAAQGTAFAPVGWYDAAFVVDNGSGALLLQSEPAQQGKIYAQSLESMLAVIALDPRPGEDILDLCAAPGSKTSQIAAQMQNQGRLIANEPVKARFYRLKSVLELLGAQARLSMKDGRYLRSIELFDRILVDAPCSSEGRFLEHDPKTYAYWSLRKVHEMAHKQKGLLLNASRLLKPGGTLVYSTCTFAPEENEAAVDWLLRKTAGALDIVPLEFSQVERLPALPAFEGKEFGPQVLQSFRVKPSGGMEGFFVAKFRKL